MSELPKTKPVCQLDADGFYLHQTVADQDPMQPENWLIPAGSLKKRHGNTCPIIAAKPLIAPTMGSLKRWKP